MSEFKKLAEAKEKSKLILFHRIIILIWLVRVGANHERPGEDFEKIGMYEVLCCHLKTPPFKDFQKQLAAVNSGQSRAINLTGKDLTDVQVRPIAMCVMVIKTYSTAKLKIKSTYEKTIL